MSFWARRSASSEEARDAANRQRRMIPAADSMVGDANLAIPIEATGYEVGVQVDNGSLTISAQPSPDQPQPREGEPPTLNAPPAPPAPRDRPPPEDEPAEDEGPP